MRKRLIVLCVMLILAAGAIPAMSAKQAEKSPPKAAAEKKVTPAICPVMGTKIPDRSKAAGGKMAYKGKIYYFCCKNCKTTFQKNPEKYANKQKKSK